MTGKSKNDLILVSESLLHGSYMNISLYPHMLEGAGSSVGSLLQEQNPQPIWPYLIFLSRFLYSTGPGIFLASFYPITFILSNPLLGPQYV